MTNFNNMNDMNEALDWNSTIAVDGNDFTLLPDGEYDFTVTEFDAGFSATGNRMAKLTLKVTGETGSTSVFDNIVLMKKMEWKLSSFFGALGQKKKGEQLVMDWNKVKGYGGRLRLKVEDYTKKDGATAQRNAVDAYIYAEDVVRKPQQQVVQQVQERQQPVQQAFAEEKQGYSANFDFKGNF